MNKNSQQKYKSIYNKKIDKYRTAYVYNIMIQQITKKIAKRRHALAPYFHMKKDIR